MTRVHLADRAHDEKKREAHAVDSRNGLSKAQVLAMSKSEITAFVATREAQAADDIVGPPELWEPKRPPQRFLLDTFAD